MMIWNHFLKLLKPNGLMIDKNILFSYLDKNFSDAHCELNYSKDYELLIAIMLSSQTTDKAVNKVTALLFAKYPSLEQLKNADIKAFS